MSARHNDQICEINITPLTDIFLVLLIIMMIVAPAADMSGLNLAVLTVGDAAPNDEKPKVLKVEVNANGEYRAGKDDVGRENLLQVIKDRGPECPDGVLIEVDPESAHEALTYALSCVVQAQVVKVAVVEKEGVKAEATPPGAGKGKRIFHTPKPAATPTAK